MAEEVNQLPHGWSTVRVRDPFPNDVRRVDEQDEMTGWLSQSTHPGRFHCHWVIGRDDDTAFWIFAISDPDVAFEFKLRFG